MNCSLAGQHLAKVPRFSHRTDHIVCGNTRVGFNRASPTLRHGEGTAEWPATGPENQGIVMSDGRSIRLPSAKFAQVREPGRNGPAVTRSPRVGRGGSNPPLCTRVPACANWNSGLS